MERVEYDPEIDPSIREEREAAEKERVLSERIRLEIERYVADHDLVPRDQAQTVQKAGKVQIPPPWETDGGAGEGCNNAAGTGKAGEADAPESPRERARRTREAARQAKRDAQTAAREANRERRAAGAAGRRKAVQGVFTGGILGSEWVRKMWPYLLGVAVVLVFYIAYDFHVQKLHLDRQRLEKEVRELSIEAVERTAERVRSTRRSAIVERLRENNIPLEEFPHPVKTIER